MIRSETNYLRQAIEKILFVLMVLVIVVLVVFFSIIIVYFLKQEFEMQLGYTNADTQVVSAFSKSIFVKNVLETELSIFLDSETEIQEIEEKNDESVKIELQEIPNIKYKIPQKYDAKNLEKGKIEVGNTKISNYSNLELDVEELSKPLSMKLGSNTNFLIFHTHATESYTVDSPYVENYRSTNPEFNMISIGKSLVEQL